MSATDLALTGCLRCGARVQFVHGQRNPEAKVLRKSAVPKGFCVCCAAAHFLQHGPEPMRSLITRSPTSLRHPQVQAQFGAILESGMSDARLLEIDWQKVLADWALPFACTPTDGFSCHQKRAPKRRGQRRA